MRHTLCWIEPSTSPIYDDFPSLFENVEPRSLFFHMDHSVTALHYFKEINMFDTILIYFKSHEPFDFLDLKSNFTSFHLVYKHCEFTSIMKVEIRDDLKQLYRCVGLCLSQAINWQY